MKISHLVQAAEMWLRWYIPLPRGQGPLSPSGYRRKAQGLMGCSAEKAQPHPHQAGPLHPLRASPATCPDPVMTSAPSHSPAWYPSDLPVALGLHLLWLGVQEPSVTLPSCTLGFLDKLFVECVNESSPHLSRIDPSSPLLCSRCFLCPECLLPQLHMRTAHLLLQVPLKGFLLYQASSEAVSLPSSVFPLPFVLNAERCSQPCPFLSLSISISVFSLTLHLHVS